MVIAQHCVVFLVYRYIDVNNLKTIENMIIFNNLLYNRYYYIYNYVVK